jgi:hypothetical protein
LGVRCHTARAESRGEGMTLARKSAVPGDIYGKLTVVTVGINENGSTVALVRCQCGAESVRRLATIAHSVKVGRTPACPACAGFTSTGKFDGRIRQGRKNVQTSHASRKHERDCAHYLDCLDDTVRANRASVPCRDCPRFVQEVHPRPEVSIHSCSLSWADQCDNMRGLPGPGEAKNGDPHAAAIAAKFGRHGVGRRGDVRRRS